MYGLGGVAACVTPPQSCHCLLDFVRELIHEGFEIREGNLGVVMQSISL